MPTRDQVTELLDHGHSYETAAHALGIPPGQAFMIATGRPADGGTTPAPEQEPDHRRLPDSSQRLVNPAASLPARNARVLDWVRERATRELRPPP